MLPFLDAATKANAEGISSLQISGIATQKLSLSQMA